MRPLNRPLALLAIVLAAIAAQGCGSGSSEPDEAALKKKLAGPPSLAGMAKHPTAAHGKPGAGGPPGAGAPPAGATPAGGQ